MNSLEQYINLYESNRDTIDAHSAGALNTCRPQALQNLKMAGRLADSGDEGFEKTSVNDMFAPDFGVNINRVDIPADVAASFRCGVPNLSTLLGVVVNDRFATTPTLLGNLPEGVTVCSLAYAAKAYPDIVDRYYDALCSQSASGPADAAARLNTLLCQDGVFIHVARGVRLEKALQIVQIFQAGFPLMAARRTLLVAEADSHLAVLKCDHTRPESQPVMSSEVVEIFAGDNATVEWYDIEESSADTARCSRMFVSQATGSSVNVCTATLTNGMTRNEFSIRVTGDHTRTRLSGMAIGSANQHIDNSSSLVHEGHHGHSNQLFKYVLDESASGAFEGSIEVASCSQFVEAYQSNRNILASTRARMHSKPQLLIYNDDVKCSHGATTGQLDENALFYMQTRGIPLNEARRMLMQAFMMDVIDSIDLLPLRDRLRHMVECRFAGQRATCSECSQS